MKFPTQKERAAVASRFSSIVFTILFITVFGLAIFTRFHAIMERTQWFDDSARDVLIAKKISQTGHFVQIAPKANMGDGILKNSYLYYNWLGWLWSLAGSEVGMIWLYTAIGLTALLFGYEIGKDIGGKWLGLLSMFALVLDTNLSQYQISIYQRSLLPYFGLAIVMLGIKVVKKPTIVSILLLHSIFTLGVLFHYSIGTFAPAIFLITIWALFQVKLKLAKKVIWMLMSAFVNTGLYFLLTNSSIHGLTAFFSNLSGIYYLGSDRLSLSNFVGMFSYIYPNANFNNYFIFELFLFEIFGAIIYIYWHWRKPNPLVVYLLFLLTFFWVPFTTNHLILIDYMRHYEVLGILIVPVVGFQLIKAYYRQFIPIWVFGFAAIIGYYYFPKIQAQHTPEFFRLETQTSREILKSTVDDYIQSTHDETLANYIVVDFASWEESPWFTPAFLFFLEQQTNRSYATLSHKNNNLRYTFNRDFKHLYLICKDWNLAYMGADYMKKDCLAPFLESRIQQIGNVSESGVVSQLFIAPEENPLQVTVFKISQKQPL